MSPYRVEMLQPAGGDREEFALLEEFDDLLEAYRRFVELIPQRGSSQRLVLRSFNRKLGTLLDCEPFRPPPWLPR